MIHQTSYRARRVIGQLTSGEDVLETLGRLCDDEEIYAGQIRVSGALEHVEVSRFDAEAKEHRVVERGGPVEIASMTGTIATIGGQVVLRFDGLLCAQGDFGPQIVTGQISSARAAVCEFVIESFEDITMVLGKDGASGRTVLSDIAFDGKAAAAAAAANRPAATPETPNVQEQVPTPEAAEATNGVTSSEESGQGQMSWGEAIEASNAEKSNNRKESSSSSASSSKPNPEDIYAGVDLPEEKDRPIMKAGDILDHPKLGRCRVMKVEDDEEYAHVRLPRGKIRKLVLEIFDIQFKGDEGGKNVFSLQIQK